MSKRARTGYYGSLAKKAHLLKPFNAGGIRGFLLIYALAYLAS